VSRSRLRLSSLLILFLVTSSVAVPLPIVGAQGMAEEVRLVVAFRRGTDDAQAARSAARGGGRIVERIPQLGVLVVELPAAAVANAKAAWASDPQVAGVETDGTVQATWTPTEPLWGYQWEQRQVRTPLAWDISRGRASTVVAVLDTGVQPTHPDLEAHLVGGHDFVNRDRRPRDDNGHGTAVAGVIGALASNHAGVAGACNRCAIMPVKVLDSSGSGYWSVAAKGIIWAADHGADVINLSFGGPSASSTLANAVAYARSRGAVVVAAAGNNGTTGYFFPAAYTGVISVAATADLDLRYSWSNYSSSWVTLAAPGCTWTSKLRSTYGSFCGTSAAAPVVAGVAALVESANPALTGPEIEAILRASGVPTPYGISLSGRIDAFEAVHRAAYGSAPPWTTLRPKAPRLPDGTRLVFRSGDHIGYRFDANGAIVATKRISLAATSGASTSKRQLIPTRAGYWFYVKDGGLTRYWVLESSRVYLAPQATPTPTPVPTATPTPTPAELLPGTRRLDPPLAVAFRAGQHTGYRMDQVGGTLSTKVLNLGAMSTASTVRVARVPNRPGSWFFVVSGALAGHWVRASNAVFLRGERVEPGSGTTLLEPTDPTFAPLQRLRFRAGEHVGIRFAMDGSVLRRRTMTLSNGSGGLAAKWMKVPNRSGQWVYVVDGTLAGFWVRDGSQSFLLP
jgi:subtilisin family serine protease